MKLNGKEWFTVYTGNKKKMSKFCINIYNTPDLNFKEVNPIKIETNNTKQLNLDRRDYPKFNIEYKSNHPEIIKVNMK